MFFSFPLRARSHWASRVGAIITFASLPVAAVAEDIQWDGGVPPADPATTNWTDPANWAPDAAAVERVPGANDNALFLDPAAGPATIDSNIAVNEIRFGTDGIPGTGTI